MRIRDFIQWAAWVPFVAAAPGCVDMGQFKDGLRAEQTGEYHRAYDIYCKAAQESPGNRLLAMSISRTAPQAATYWEDRAHQAVDRGQYAEAWQLFMRVLEIRPDHPSAPHLIRRLERDHPDAVADVRMAYLTRGDRTLLASAARSEPAVTGRPVASLQPRVIERARISSPAEPAPTATAAPPADKQPDDVRPVRTSDTMQGPAVAATPQAPEPVSEPATASPTAAATDSQVTKTPTLKAPVASAMEEPNRSSASSGVVQTPPSSEVRSETGRSSATVSKRVAPEAEGSSSQQRQVVQERETVRRYRSVGQEDRSRRPSEPVAQRRPAPLFSSPPPLPKSASDEDKGDRPDSNSQFLLVRSLSKKDKDFPKKAEMVDGLIVELRDTDGDGTVDLGLYIGRNRISKVKGIHVGDAVLISGRSGRAYEVVVLSIVDKRGMARIGVRASKRADLLYHK